MICGRFGFCDSKFLSFGFLRFLVSFSCFGDKISGVSALVNCLRGFKASLFQLGLINPCKVCKYVDVLCKIHYNSFSTFHDLHFDELL